MSTLTLVRHGQAQRFQAADAALSATGEAQAGALAAWWKRQGIVFDEIYCGALPRQCRTAQAVAEAMGAAWPAAVCDPRWNEYDATNVLRRFATEDLADAEPRRFQRVFEAAMTQWLEAGEAEAFEPWQAFRDRVDAALREIMEGPSGRRVAVFTSGGPIGFAVHRAMQAPARAFLDVNWRVRNGSITEFLFDRSRLTLDSFNAIPHLDRPELRTYR